MLPSGVVRPNMGVNGSSVSHGTPSQLPPLTITEETLCMILRELEQTNTLLRDALDRLAKLETSPLLRMGRRS